MGHTRITKCINWCYPKINKTEMVIMKVLEWLGGFNKDFC